MGLPRLILASASPRRRTLLQQVGLQFEVLAVDVDETPQPGMAPVEFCRQVARRKAEAALARLGPRSAGRLVLAADTVVALDRDILGKPGNAAEAASMLGRLQGRSHRVVSAVALAADGRIHVEHEETQVFMASLNPAQIAAYVRSGEPLDKAGAYAVQGLGAVLVERIAGCYYNVVGLPLPRVARMLRRHGIEVLG